jgi:hypothetical protein
MLRRRAGYQDSIVEDEDTSDALPRSEHQQETKFLPDDYVEEEAPSPEEHESDQVAIAPDDDVILSENASPGSPRSRRIRRTREQPVDPKPQAVVETDVDVATPAIESDQKMTVGQGRFDSVPEISAGIDLSRLRHQAQRSDDPMPRAPETPSTRSDTTAVEEPFERAIRNAQAIKATARAEREERPKVEIRPRTTTVRATAPEPRQAPDAQQHHDVYPNVIPDLVDEPLDQDIQGFGSSSSTTGQQSTHASVSTRHVDERDLPGLDEYDVEEETRSNRALRREDVRGSWWRGLFQSRQSETSVSRTDDEPWAYENDRGYDDPADAFEDESPIAASVETWAAVEPDPWQPHIYDEVDSSLYDLEPMHASAYTYADEASDFENHRDDEMADPRFESHEHVEMAPQATHAQYEPLDLQHEQGLSAFRDRLFVRGDEETTQYTTSSRVATAPRRSPISLARKRSITRDEPMRAPVYAEEVSRAHDDYQDMPRVTGHGRAMQGEPAAIPTRPVPEDLLVHPADAWYEPERDQQFDVRDIIAQSSDLLDMTIEISPDIPRDCATCRSYRQSEQGERGWCTNNWAFTHRQMVNATDLACQSTIGCWWLPADEEVWLTEDEPDRGATPRVDRLIAHLDPLKRAVGR